MSLDLCLFRLLHHRAGACWPLDAPVRLCARYGSWLEIGLMVAVGLRRGAAGRRALARCLLAVGWIYGLVELIGRLATRPRPFAAGGPGRALLPHAPERSFPSRHVASATAMALLVLPVHRRLGGVMAVLALGLGLSRIRAGLHYPSDVLAGGVLGWWVAATLRPAR